MGNVTVLDARGDVFGDVPEEQLAGYLARGYRVQTSAERTVPIVEAAREERFGGPTAAAAAAGIYGGLGTVTGGLSDATIAAVGGNEGLRDLQELHPIAHGIGAVAGAFVPAGLPGMAGRAGAAIRAGSEGLGLAGAIGRGALAGAAEGALYGAGQGVSEIALDDHPLTYERAASTLSSNMLFGAATGGVIGGAGAALERGMLRAKGAIDEAMARKAVEDTTPDLASMDKRGLSKAQDLEVERIDVERAPAKQQLVSDVQDYREQGIEAGLKDAAEEGMHIGEVREASAAYRRASTDLRQALDNRAALAENPAKLEAILQRQEQAMSTIKVWGDRAVADWDGKVRAIPDQIRSDIIAGKVSDFPVPSALTARGVDSAVEHTMLKRYGNLTGPEYPKTLRIVEDKLTGAIEKNRELQQRIRSLVADPTSERLTQIDAAREALGVPKEKSLGQHILGAAAHVVGGPAATIATTGARMLGGLKNAVGKVAERAGGAASTMLGAGAKVAARAPVATKILAAVRYAPADERAEPEPRGRSLQQLYTARTDEIKSQTAYDETGTPRLRPEARQAMTARLRGIAAVDPILADRIETLAARRIEYLSSLIPRQPEVGGLPIGPRQPSDMALRSFARSVAATEDPHGVLERAAGGGVITPEDIGALQNVHPEILAAWTNDVMTGVAQGKKRLSTDRKIALSLLTGRPIDPAMDPALLSVFQAQYQYEPAPGPRAEAQFGSVKNRAEVGTASQRREEGTG